MIRLFAAIAVPEEIGLPLLERQCGLEGARWRPLEALHITLRFFGEVQEPVADDIDAELSLVTSPPFGLELAGVGAFGEGRDIRALWAGLTDSEPLRQLAGRCETAARRAGLKPDTRHYHPHLTMAYLRRPEPDAVARWIQSHNLLKSPPFGVDRFGLYSSHRTGEGSRYVLEREYRL